MLDVGADELAYRSLATAEDEVAHGNDSDEAAIVIGDVKIGNAALAFLGFALEQLQALIDGLVGAQANKLVAHDAAGGVGRIDEEFANVRLFVGGEARHHLRSALPGQFGND